MKMMERGGYYSDGFSRRYIPVVREPKNIEILMVLDLIKDKKKGVLELENILAEDECEPQKLTLHFENSNYLIMLLDYDEHGYIEIRTPYNPNASQDRFQNILDEPYGATTVLQDFEIVKKCFIEFNDTGNVSKDVLN